MSIPDNTYIEWLVSQSMLHAARERSRHYAGQARLWQRPYAQARPRDASAIASVWFTAYPAAIITPEGGTVLEASATTASGVRSPNSACRASTTGR